MFPGVDEDLKELLFQAAPDENCADQPCPQQSGTAEGPGCRSLRPLAPTTKPPLAAFFMAGTKRWVLKSGLSCLSLPLSAG